MRKDFAEKARSSKDNPKSPSSVQAEYAAAVVDNKWATELEGIIQDSLHRQESLQQLCKYGPMDPTSIKSHTKLAVELLSRRGQSLASAHLLPPHRYAGNLHCNKQVQRQAHKQTLTELRILQEAEQQMATGLSLPPLKAINWRLNKATRLLLVATKQDEDGGKALVPSSSSMKIHRAANKHFDDSYVTRFFLASPC